MCSQLKNAGQPELAVPPAPQTWAAGLQDYEGKKFLSRVPGRTGAGGKSQAGHRELLSPASAVCGVTLQQPEFRIQRGQVFSKLSEL